MRGLVVGALALLLAFLVWPTRSLPAITRLHSGASGATRSSGELIQRFELPPITTTSTTPLSTVPTVAPTTTPVTVTSPPPTTVPPTTVPPTTTTITSDGVTPALRAKWQRVADCEEGGNWHVVGSVYSGIGFKNSTWASYAPEVLGPNAPSNAGMASEDQQIMVGMRINHGWVPDQDGCAAW